MLFSLLALLYVASTTGERDVAALTAEKAVLAPVETLLPPPARIPAFTSAPPALPALLPLPVRHRELSSPAPADWDFSGTGIRESELQGYLRPRSPAMVVYIDRHGVTRFIEGPRRLSAEEAERMLYVSELEYVRQIAEAREQDAAREAEEAAARETADTDTAENEKRLPENAFEVVSFRPGTRDDGRVLAPVTDDALAALQGPDYSLAPFNWRDPEAMRAHLSKILSLGHGGDLVLKVAGGGYLKDGPGFDFTLFENSFRTEGGLSIIQEFGHVGVAEAAEGPYHWFPCAPPGELRGCLGAVPSAEGGDQFDLARLGLERVRYLRIRDTGNNQNKPSEWPTEGCDLDAVRLLNAYSED